MYVIYITVIKRFCCWCESSHLTFIWLIPLVAQGLLDMEGALTARDRVGIQDFVLLDETTEAAFISNLKKRFSNDLIYVSHEKEYLNPAFNKPVCFVVFLSFFTFFFFTLLDLHWHIVGVCKSIQGAGHLQ